MITLMIVGLAIGAVLGMRFNVFVLFPAMLVAVPVSVGIASVQGGGVWHTLLAIVLSITALQLGFLVGGIVLHAGRRPLQTNGNILEAGGWDQPQYDQLVAAHAQLDDMVPELIAVSKQMTEQPAGPPNVRAADRRAVSGSPR
jgi:hypothetical protein